MKRSFLAIGALMIVGAMNAQTTQATTTYVGKILNFSCQKMPCGIVKGIFNLTLIEKNQ